MKKNFSRIASVVLAALFLFSTMSVFAAPGGYTAPILSEKFDSIWPVGTAFEIPTESGEVDFYNGWKLKTTVNNVTNTTMSVKNVDGIGKVLSFEKSAYKEGQTGTADYRFLKKPLTFDAETDVATIEFKVRRMEIGTTSLILHFNDDDFFQFNLRSAYVIRRTSSSNPGFKGGMVQQPEDTWHNFMVKLDYDKEIMDIYLNGTRMTPYSNTKSGTEYSDGNMPFSVAFPVSVEAESTKSFPDFAIGIRGIQNATTADAEIQLTDVVVNEYSNEQIEEEEARKEAEAWAKVTDAVDAHFGVLNGAKLAAGIPGGFVNSAELQAVLDQANATITWASSNTSYLSDAGAIVARPAEGSAPVDVTLTATITNGTNTTNKVYSVTVLPENITVYEDSQVYFGSEDYLADMGWKVNNSNIEASVVSESGANNALRIKNVSSDAAFSLLTGLVCDTDGGGGSKGGTEIGFRIKRENAAAKKIYLHLEYSSSRRLAIGFDLVTGRISFPMVSISGVDTVAVPAYPAGSSIYSPDLVNLEVGEWAEVSVYIPNLQGAYGRSLIVYVDGKPCLYEAAATDSEIAVKKDQPMYSHTVSSAWPNNTSRTTTISVNPAENGADASFLIDNFMLKGMDLESGENICHKVIRSVLERQWNEYSATIEDAPVINTTRYLTTTASPADSVTWSASVEGLIKDNKITLPDAEDITEVDITATVISGDVSLSRTWTMKVAPRIMSSVKGVGIAENKLNSVSIDKVCALPENTRVIVGVYNNEGKLEECRILTPSASSEDETITLETPLSVDNGEIVKAFVLDMANLTPLAVDFE